MNPNDLGNELERLIIAVGLTLTTSVGKAQNYLWNQVLKILKRLDLGDAGDILQTADNRKIIIDATNALEGKLSASGYQQAIEKYLSTFGKIDKLNNAYFESIAAAFKPNRQFVVSLQKNAIQQVEDLLFNAGFESQVKIPLQQILNQNINSGGNFSDMLDQVRMYVKGTPDIDGKLMKYTRTVTKDTLFDYSRAFQAALAKDLDLTWYCYSGGLMDKSRQFCIDRAGHYFPKNEIESWADEDWKGKRPDTTKSSIFVFCGGYNCTHSLIPVSKTVVPAEDVVAAVEAGF